MQWKAVRCKRQRSSNICRKLKRKASPHSLVLSVIVLVSCMLIAHCDMPYGLEVWQDRQWCIYVCCALVCACWQLQCHCSLCSCICVRLGVLYVNCALWNALWPWGVAGLSVMHICVLCSCAVFALLFLSHAYYCSLCCSIGLCRCSDAVHILKVLVHGVMWSIFVSP